MGMEIGVGLPTNLRGTHKELVKTGGLYAQLVSRQQAKDDENLNVDQLIDGIREVDGDEDEKDT